jgi:outer membrane protein
MKGIFKTILTISLLNVLAVSAQKTLSLENCIEIALSNNQDFKNNQLQTQISKVKIEQSKLEKLPSLNSDFSQGFNLGRNIDPFSNQFVTQPINSANLSLSSNYTIYNGGIIDKTIKINQLENAIGLLETEKTKIEIKKNLSLSYLEVVLKKEILKIKKEQKNIILEQLKRSQQLQKFGNESLAANIDLEAQLESENYQIVEAESNLKIAKLRLLQVLNQKDLTDIEVIEPSNISIANQNFGQQLTGIAHLRQKQLEINYADLKISLKESEKKPTVFLSSGVFSNYSSQAPKRIKNLGGEPKKVLAQSPNQFTKIGDKEYPIFNVFTSPNIKEQNFGYVNQLFSNLGLGLKLNFQYPIYDKGLRNSEIQTQKVQKIISQNNYLKAEQELSNTLKEFRTNIEIAKAKYTQAQNLEKAFSKSFDISKIRFEEGMIRINEFNQSKLNLESAKSNVIQNKLTYYYYSLIYKYFVE